MKHHAASIYHGMLPTPFISQYCSIYILFDLSLFSLVYLFVPLHAWHWQEFFIAVTVNAIVVNFPCYILFSLAVCSSQFLQMSGILALCRSNFLKFGSLVYKWLCGLRTQYLIRNVLTIFSLFIWNNSFLKTKLYPNLLSKDVRSELNRNQNQ